MRVSFGLTLVAAAIATAVPSAQAPASNGGDVMTRVGARIAEYYKRAQSVICIEKYLVQPIGRDWSAVGIPRTTESELRVEADAGNGEGPGEAKVIRELRRVNGRAPRERDKKDRSGCTDLNPLSPEPLAFLLPARRSEYHFVSAGMGKGKDSHTLLIDFTSAAPRSRIELIEDERGHDDCFDFKGSVPKKGRIWVDAATYDVLRVEERTVAPIEVHVPFALRRRYMLLDDQVVIEREDQTIRYKRVTFRDPDEAMLLPESIVQLVVVRGGLQSTRRSQTFTDYRRFVTGARLVR